MIDRPKFVYFFFRDSVRNYPIIEFWLENEKININAQISDFEANKKSYFSTKQLTGSELNDLYSLYRNRTDGLLKKKGKKELDRATVDFVFENPNNIFSQSLVFKGRSNLFKDTLNAYYEKLDSSLQSNLYGVAIKKAFSGEILKIGDPFIEISAKDLSGRVVNLSNLKGKVILLDFWASWCQPCRMLIRNQYISLYQKYKHKGFEIVNFSLDTDYNLWDNASKEDNISWTNISDLQGTQGSAVIDYNVQGIPRSFLIDKHGIIRFTDLGYNKNDDIETRVVQLLSE